MPYEPTNWKSGDVVTSAKLNKIEAGIASGGVLVATDTEGTLDKTWQEIHDAALCVVYLTETGKLCVNDTGEIDGSYMVVLANSGIYKASSASGYPVYEGETPK